MIAKKEEYLQQVSDKETAVILEELKKTFNTPGDIVEFGCYRGDTSLLIEKNLEKEFESDSFTKGFWIYDSFEGLPSRTREDASVAGDGFSEGELKVSKREVVERFKKAGLKVPRVRKGFFENLSSDDLPETIAFAFLDGDLYQSIKTSFSLVTPRMAHDENGNLSGTIIVHDYNNPKLPGVAKAVEEWMAAQKTAPRLQRRESLAIISW